MGPSCLPFIHAGPRGIITVDSTLHLGSASCHTGSVTGQRYSYVPELDIAMAEPAAQHTAFTEGVKNNKNTAPGPLGFLSFRYSCRSGNFLQ